MVDIVKESIKLFNELGNSEIEVEIIKKRNRFPDIVFDTKRKKLTIFGNEPSLVRLCLGYIITHELAHLKYRENNKRSNFEDFDPEFQKIERELIERLWEICRISDPEICEHEK